MNPQPKNTQNIYRVVVLIIAIGIAAYLYMHQTHKAPVSGTGVATSTIPTSQATVASSTASGATGAYTIQALPLPTGTKLPPAPNYKLAITCTSAISTSQCSTLQSEAVTLQSRITKNGQDLQSWINLGTLHKTAGDYQTAILYWQYMTKMYPDNPAAFNNLGDIYTNFVKDYSKAESNYLTAIKVFPSDPAPYKNLFVLYTTTSYTGGVGAAEAILKKGIVANPKAVDLEVTLARYYKSLGRTADSKAAFDAAISSAQSQGQTQLATQIQQEAIQ